VTPVLSSPTSLIHAGSLGAGSLERSAELLEQPLAGYMRASCAQQ